MPSTSQPTEPILAGHYHPSRAVMIGGEIGAELLRTVTPRILELRAQPAEPITVFIDSPGGSLIAMNQLMTLLGLHGDDDESLEIVTLATGMAASCAADLLTAGRPAGAMQSAVIHFHGTRTFHTELTEEGAHDHGVALDRGPDAEGHPGGRRHREGGRAGAQIDDAHGSVGAGADVAVIVVGVNDITKEVPLAFALRQRQLLADWLHVHAGVKQVVFPALPEMELFPALPRPLAWYAGQAARRNNRAHKRWAVALPGVAHLDMVGVAHPSLFCEDGFHPAPALYARVAERLADHIAALTAAAAVLQPTAESR